MPMPHSLLFVPGDRPERFDKAAQSGAHDIILDLEDAVGVPAKDAAREQVRQWLQTSGRAAIVRINAASTPWFEADLQMVQALPQMAVMLPKADAASLRTVVERLPGRRILGLLETVAAYMELDAVAQVKGLTQLVFGSVDFSSESGVADEGQALDAVRVQIVLASLYRGLLPPIDGVSVQIGNPAQIGQDAYRSRQLGFGGKLCIHPSQVEPVNKAFAPSAAELDWAKRVLAAFEASAGAAIAVDGKMVDKPVVEKARRIQASLG